MTKETPMTAKERARKVESFCFDQSFRYRSVDAIARAITEAEEAARKAEKEACAKVAKNYTGKLAPVLHEHGQKIAAAIQARRKK